MSKLIFVFFFLLIRTVSFGQIKIGEKINLTQMELLAINQSKIDTSKIIVIDFWATWCAPCIASFPHLDSIQKDYQAQVQVIALSDEPPQKISDFLKSREYTFSFFADAKKLVYKRFDVESRPTTAILDANGTLIWVGSSTSLQLVLNDYISKKIITSPTKIDYAYKKYYSSSVSVD